MIKFFEEDKVFKLDTENTSYLIGIADDKYIGHIYYGKRISSANIEYLLRIYEPPFVPSKNNRDKLSFLDCFPMEYPSHGIGDFREDAFAIRTLKGHVAAELLFDSFEIVAGKPELKGLPASFENQAGDNKAETLLLHLTDPVLKLKVTLSYSVFDDSDVIVRSAKVVNQSKEAIYITKMYSASMDFDNEDYELLTLNGSWARERHIDRKEIGMGFQGVSSLRGEPSHQHHPFIAVLERHANQDTGNVYAMNFVYSGNFIAKVYQGQFNNLRMMMGINDEDFSFKLEENEELQAPEVVMTFSSEGLGKMTRTYHDFYRNHLIRSPFKNKKRPILINNWEATYFDFDTDKLISIAREAAKLGIEMLVMDDGWFGNRCDDNRALGDWFVNEDKLKGGLKNLVDRVNAEGLKFGIWFEPEMISPDSRLYKEHPDWAFKVPERTAGLCRNQYVLDITRDEVRDYILDRMIDILSSANIEYVKWDMNRQLADLGSINFPEDRQGEIFHRYVLAMYQMQEKLLERFPDLLLENCSGGGARFDPGMLYYSPQIWCSDDTDAIERLMIQEGTALIYPLSTMGAHVSDCPNHTVGRTTPFETRGYVALAGTFGYELDVTRISEADRNMIPKQCKMYHDYHSLIADGDYYRIASYQENNHYDSYMTVAKDKSEALLTFVQVRMRANHHSRIIKLKGLKPDENYRIYKYDIDSAIELPYAQEVYGDRVITGDALMNAGLVIENIWGDFKSLLLVIRQCT